MRYSLEAVVAVFCAVALPAIINAKGICEPATAPTPFSIKSIAENDLYQQQRKDAYALFRAQRFQESAEKYEHLTHSTTATASDCYWLGEALYHQNKFEEAAAQFSQSVGLEPKADAVRVRVVEAYMAARKNELAANACHVALAQATDPGAKKQLEALNKLVDKKGSLFPSLSMKETVETPNNSKRHP